LCYARADAAAVDLLHEALADAGIAVWRDTAELWPGEDWREKIRQAIRHDAVAFVACFSRAAVQRDKSMQFEELNWAIEVFRGYRLGVSWLIPVRFDDCEIPDVEIGSGRSLSSLQRADLFGEGQHEQTKRVIGAVMRMIAPPANVVSMRDQAKGQRLFLPLALARRFVVIRHLQKRVACDLYHVRDSFDGADRILKIYGKYNRLDRRVFSWLSSSGGKGNRNEHVVEVLEFGQLNGHWYALTEYISHGDLEATASAVLLFRPSSLNELIRQTAEALITIHAAGIVHLDVRPGTIGLRSLVPFDIVLTDFEESAYIGQHEQRFYPERFLRADYAAPEWSFAALQSPAADWWALGMTIIELACGRHPFADVSDESIYHHFVTGRPVDLSGMTDPRVRMLCEGLVEPDNYKRWTYNEVTQWLSGGFPEIPKQPGHSN